MPVVVAYARVDPWTVVVKSFHTTVTDITVSAACRSQQLALVADEGWIGFAQEHHQGLSLVRLQIPRVNRRCYRPQDRTTKECHHAQSLKPLRILKEEKWEPNEVQEEVTKQHEEDKDEEHFLGPLLFIHGL